MCVARYASHYFSKGAICVSLDDQEKNICTLSSHRATRELYAKVPSHRAPVGALCEGSMRIELRSELYAEGALCGSTVHPWFLDMSDRHFRDFFFSNYLFRSIQNNFFFLRRQ